MSKSKNTGCYMSDEDLKVLKKSLKYVKKLDFLNKDKNKEQSNKTKKLRKVA